MKKLFLLSLLFTIIVSYTGGIYTNVTLLDSTEEDKQSILKLLDTIIEKSRSVCENANEQSATKFKEAHDLYTKNALLYCKEIIHLLEESLFLEKSYASHYEFASLSIQIIKIRSLYYSASFDKNFESISQKDYKVFITFINDEINNLDRWCDSIKTLNQDTITTFTKTFKQIAPHITHPALKKALEDIIGIDYSSLDPIQAHLLLEDEYTIFAQQCYINEFLTKSQAEQCTTREEIHNEIIDTIEKELNQYHAGTIGGSFPIFSTFSLLINYYNVKEVFAYLHPTFPISLFCNEIGLKDLKNSKAENGYLKNYPVLEAFAHHLQEQKSTKHYINKHYKRPLKKALLLGTTPIMSVVYYGKVLTIILAAKLLGEEKVREFLERYYKDPSKK